MKNIHVLPTDKPSRLHIDVIDGSLCLFSDNLIHKPTGLHIYITNSEEIKEGDWYLDTFNTQRIKANQFSDHKHYGNACKKIILTTDQDLIKDGVQPIDDEFLEWFVKNPSCEFVEILIKTKTFDKDGFISSVICDTKNVEKIYSIIPQEEPNPFELPKVLPDDVFFKSLEESKQETLEEAAENNYPEGDVWTVEQAVVRRLAFMNGANWEAKKSYSEEEVFSIIDKAFHMYASSHRHDAKEWFEQFKKK